MDFLTVVACLLFDLLHLRLKLFHLGHRGVGFVSQREKNKFDDEGQSDDRPTHIADKSVQVVQQPEHWLGDEEEPAPIDTVEELGYAAFVFVVADRFPLFCTCEQAR